MQQRIQKNPYLDLFDGSDGTWRSRSAAPQRRLYRRCILMNSKFLTEQSRLIATRAAGSGVAFETIFGRPAKAAELSNRKPF